jgi:hypothetical protein
MPGAQVSRKANGEWSVRSRVERRSGIPICICHLTTSGSPDSSDVATQSGSSSVPDSGGHDAAQPTSSFFRR